MSKIANTITMAMLLNNGRKYSVNELVEFLEVTPRMIRIYKDELEKCGIYIDTIRGPYGGYVLNQRVRMPDLNFSTDDIKLLESLKTKSNQREIQLLINKLLSVQCKVDINIDDQELKKYNLVSKAIKEQRKIKILYNSLNKGHNERLIKPYNLFLYNNGWGVTAFCEVAKDLRHFELLRIIEIELI